jgi:D-3-phosphoglycerate dehydrogenase
VLTVLVTDHPAPTTLIEAAILERVGAQLVVADRGDEAELVKLAASADAILTCFRQVTPAVVAAGRSVKVIARYGIGVDNIAVDAATERGIPVVNVPEYCTDEVAEHTIAMLLSLARRLNDYDGATRTLQWGIQAGAPIHRLAGSTLGVVGYGHIGRAVAKRALGLGMRVLAHDPGTNAAAQSNASLKFVDLETLLRESDAATLHVPLTPETRHLINRDRLALMPSGAVLINCSRGSVVDLDALADALDSDHLSGAGLDVFDREPLPAGHRLLTTSHLILTPHVAFYSEESVAELQRLAAENVAAVLIGARPVSIVNPMSAGAT